MLLSVLFLPVLFRLVAAKVDPWTERFADTPDLPFSGITTFAHLPHERCLSNPDGKLDIAIIGVPFDNAVSYRPGESIFTAQLISGARFGPYGIRSGSRRQRPERGYSLQLNINPYQSGATILDCGDIPVTPFDTAVAIQQIKAAYSSLLHRHVVSPDAMESLGMIRGLDGEYHPRLVALGGDHTIVSLVLSDRMKLIEGSTHPSRRIRGLRSCISHPSRCSYRYLEPR